MSACTNEDPRILGIKTKIRVVPNFPKPGIMFQDITTLLLDPKAFKDTIDLFVERYKGKNISVVAGVEARGFIFGPPIALAIGAKFVPLRKPKKLPGKVISQDYILEYGRDCLEMHVGAVQPGERALVVDDLIATGGTLCAAMDLLAGVIPQSSMFLWRRISNVFLRQSGSLFPPILFYSLLLMARTTYCRVWSNACPGVITMCVNVTGS
ncbi:adenine phosphoribosyltransferase 3 isoform X2 [Neltuma alba]|uniref:adenine phosphoribosyltransferase 3 isoform X2 n=1 Tax=Neltuma alba TaxID=207710 RepID=UPI0010A436EA|nr:adenine phosphoribosyltransferase 3-like isoform X2 [Prosopis alba]